MASRDRDGATVSADVGRALPLLNGAGAVALIVFLQGIWGEQPELVPAALGSLALVTGGLLSGAFVNHARAIALRGAASGAPEAPRWELVARSLAVGSLLCFAGACALLVLGALAQLPPPQAACG